MGRITILLALCVAGAVAGGFWWSSGLQAPGLSAFPWPPPAAPEAELGNPPAGEPAKQKGVTFVAWYAGQYSNPDADLSLNNLASTGANWISLIVTGYQDTITSTAVYTVTDSPSDGELAHVIQQAHRLGLKVMLKPHVDVFKEPSEWRGRIGGGFVNESQWEAWFAAYTSFIEHYARLAQAYGVEQFCVGTELTATTHRTADWRRVVSAVRAAYGGPLTYASDYIRDSDKIAWWDALDYIGVEGYLPLANRDSPGPPELKAGWSRYVPSLAKLASTWGKPVLFTEVGFQSKTGSARQPWEASGSLDLRLQADAYATTFESLWDQPWFGGMFWWAWSPDPFDGGPCDDHFTPQDKPAEEVLRTWYSAPPPPAEASRLWPDYRKTFEIYADGLGPGWQDWSWGARRNLLANDNVHTGTRAISASLDPGGALSFWRPSFSTGGYQWLEFYVRGSAAGSQQLLAYLSDDGGAELRKRPVNDCRYVEGGVIEPGVWKRVLIPLSHLNANGKTLSRIFIQDGRGQTSNTFWVDDIKLVGAKNTPD